MRKKGLILAVIVTLMLAGCDEANEPEDKRPTPASDAVEEESAEKDEDEDEESEGMSSIMSFLNESKEMADKETAVTLKSALQVACAEAQYEWEMVFPEEPIRFRYTKDLEELDDSYPLLKEIILEVVGQIGVRELQVKGNYMMVEISEGGKVTVELLHE